MAAAAQITQDHLPQCMLCHSPAFKAMLLECTVQDCSATVTVCVRCFEAQKQLITNKYLICRSCCPVTAIRNRPIESIADLIMVECAACKAWCDHDLFFQLVDNL